MEEKDRFGEKIRLVERAREDIYFAAKDLELIEKLKASLKKLEAPKGSQSLAKCPKCSGKLESYSFKDILLDRCDQCGGVWLDKGELEGILRTAARIPFASFLRWLLIGEEEAPHREVKNESKRKEVHHGV